MVPEPPAPRPPLPPPAAPLAPAWRRLHPASILFHLLGILRGLLLPALAALIFSRRDYDFWIVVFAVPAAVGALLKYWAYQYQLHDAGLVVRQGVLRRQERHIPFARIENLSLVQNLIHRWLGVAEVRLETAGGSEPEAIMRVVSLAEVETFRAGVAAARPAAGTGAPSGTADVAPVGEADPTHGAPQPHLVPPAGHLGAAGAQASGLAPGPDAGLLLRLSARDLVVFGLVAGRGLVALAAAMGVVWQLDLVSIETLREQQQQLAAWAKGLALPSGLATTATIILLLLAAAIVLRLLSVVWAFLRLHNFTLERTGDQVRLAYGLLTRITATIPRRRIQSLTVQTRPLHRVLERACIRVVTAGGSRGGKDRESEQLWLAPIVSEEDVAPLVAQVLPDVSLTDLAWQRLAPRAQRRLVRRSVLILGLVTAVAALAWGPWALAIFVIGLPVALGNAALYVKHTAWATSDHAIFFRSGWWVRRLSVARFSKLQVVGLHESPFDRRHRMASVEVDTAGGGRLGHRIKIPYLEAATARALTTRLSREAGATAFSW